MCVPLAGLWSYSIPDQPSGSLLLVHHKAFFWVSGWILTCSMAFNGSTPLTRRWSCTSYRGGKPELMECLEPCYILDEITYRNVYSFSCGYLWFFYMTFSRASFFSSSILSCLIQPTLLTIANQYPTEKGMAKTFILYIVINGKQEISVPWSPG